MEKTQDLIGKTFPQAHRDAIHIAVLPAKATEGLYPGQNVGYLNGNAVNADPIGIVDPFLKDNVKAGETFFIFMYPNTITSLRHAWTHPSVPDASPIAATIVPSQRAASEAWLRDWISSNDCPSYEETMAAAVGAELPDNEDDWASYHNDGVYVHFNNIGAHSSIPPEFWNHVEIVTGVPIPQTRRASSFSCSC